MSRGAELYTRRPPAQAVYNWCTIIKGPWQRQLTPEKCLVDWTFGPSSSSSFPEAWVLQRGSQPSKRSPRDRQWFHSGRPKTYPSPVPWAWPRVLRPLLPSCLRSPSADTKSSARLRLFSHCANPSAELPALTLVSYPGASTRHV